MKFAIILLIFLFTMTSAVALDYWIVVEEEGTAIDVIHGIDYAASMKATLGVTFESKLEEDARDEIAFRDGDVFAVTFRGDAVEILFPTASSYDRLTEASSIYLRDQGFDVTLVPQEKSELMEEDEPVELPEIEDEVIVEEIIEPEPVLIAEPVVEEQIDAPSLDVVPEDTVKKPNFIVRMWRWFVGIFS
ncbi:hypothetical protein GOV11_04625 [Candidatus Woesearchaeota archaeon]|nr:hypothetical protein [Candidatus Woesearchaeota archaeon]